MLVPLREEPEQLDAGHSRHPLIRDDDVERSLLRADPRVVARRRVFHPAFAAQRAREELDGAALVVHDENRRAARLHGFGSAPPGVRLSRAQRVGTRGELDRKQLPRPISLRTRRRPEWRATIPNEIARPSPVPRPTSFVVKNGSKIWSRRSAAMPQPSSPIPIATSGAARSARITIRPPSPTASAAFERRFMNTCRIWPSRHSTAGSSSTRATPRQDGAGRRAASASTRATRSGRPRSGSRCRAARRCGGP